MTKGLLDTKPVDGPVIKFGFNYDVEMQHKLEVNDIHSKIINDTRRL